MAISSNRDQKYANVNSVQGGLYDVLIELKNNVMRSLNVATLAEVQTVNKTNQTVTVTPFPLIENEISKNIICYSCMFQKVIGFNTTWASLIDELSIHDIVLVVFLNRNSSQNLQQSKKNQKRTALNQNVDLHSEKYGIIVGLCHKFTR